MAIIVHLPDEEKSVAIPECSNLHEMSMHGSKSLKKVAYSHIFFQKIFGYMELINQGKITHKEAQNHIEEFAQLYNANLLDFDLEQNDEISKKVFDVMNQEEFEEKYSVFLQVVSGEIFRVFASGAMSHKEGDVELGAIPHYMKPHVPTKA